MFKKILTLGLLIFAVLGLLASTMDADFIQCPGGGGCDGSDNSDVITGTVGFDGIFGSQGNDIIFGDAGDDSLDGEAGNDVVFGGLDSDVVLGKEGNDVLMAGPDRLNTGQAADGDEGNDTFNVLVSDVSACLLIFAGPGNDEVNLLGFGPYTAQAPFGPDGFTEGWIHVIDPITGGDIFIAVTEDGDTGAETINGLLSPNPTLLIGTDPNEVIACDDTIPEFI